MRLFKSNKNEKPPEEKKRENTDEKLEKLQKELYEELEKKVNICGSCEYYDRTPGPGSNVFESLFPQTIGSICTLKKKRVAYENSCPNCTIDSFTKTLIFSQEMMRFYGTSGVPSADQIKEHIKVLKRERKTQFG
jgi:hypothetical protein